MHLKLTGHHLEITPALRSYVEKKLERGKERATRLAVLQTTGSFHSLAQLRNIATEIHFPKATFVTTVKKWCNPTSASYKM